MKNLFLISSMILMFFSLNANAQCCPASKSEKTVAINNHLQTSKTVKLKITGMTCAGCSATIYNALKEVDGVIEHSVEYPGDIAIIEFDETKTNIKALINVIEKKDYKAALITEKKKEKV